MELKDAKANFITVSRLCKELGMSRQNYYKIKQHREKKGGDEHFVIELVKKERLLQPMLGGRKLLTRLREKTV